MIRRSENDKESFRNYLLEKLETANYLSEVDEGRYRFSNVNNIITRNINNCDVIFTAHYDTPQKDTMLFKFERLISSIFGKNKLIFVVSALIFISALVFIPIKFNLEILSLFNYLMFVAIIIMAIIRKYNFNDGNPNNMIDNTSGVMTLLMLAELFEGNERVGFIFFDNEELGLKGSKYFAEKMYREEHSFKNKIIINCDCVASLGSANEVWGITKNEKNPETISQYNRILNYINSNLVSIEIKSKSSDHASFKKNNYISISKQTEGKLCGYYLKNIHSDKDTFINRNDIEVISNLLYNSVSEILQVSYV